MDLEITQRERNDLLEREELKLSIDHDGDATPAENAVRKQLAAEEDFDPKAVRIDHIYSSTGKPTATAIVKVFDDPIMDELPDEDTEESEESEGAETEDEAAEEPEETETDTEEQEETEAAEAEEDADEDAETEEAADETDEAAEDAEDDD